MEWLKEGTRKEPRYPIATATGHFNRKEPRYPIATATALSTTENSLKVAILKSRFLSSKLDGLDSSCKLCSMNKERTRDFLSRLQPLHQAKMIRLRGRDFEIAVPFFYAAPFASLPHPDNSPRS
jgi:hypothetical protein